MRSLSIFVVGVVLWPLFLSTSEGADTSACAAIDDRTARLKCYTAVEVIIAIVGRVVDGDTIDICIGASCIRVRLCGIGAPERGEPGAGEATEALRRPVSRGTVRCLPVGQGTVCDGRSRSTNHGRLVAQCFINGTDIGGAMVERGLACDWERFSGGHYGRMGNGRACRR
jgi:endonuclease YncB( thermonuclease family)